MIAREFVDAKDDRLIPLYVLSRRIMLHMIYRLHGKWIAFGRTRSIASGIAAACFVIATATVLVASEADTHKPNHPEKPRVVLIGDSIRIGYAPKVAEILKGDAIVVGSSSNGGDSESILKHLDEWVIAEKPDLVHINCGLHDLKRSKADGSHQVEIERYRANIRTIVERIRKSTRASIIFASTTPIIDERHAQRKADFDRTEADVVRYNAAMIETLRDLDVPIDDLHAIVQNEAAGRIMRSDGTHYEPEGYDKLAEAVADCVRRRIAIDRYRPLAQPPSGPQAANAYLRAAAERDRNVPERFRLPVVAELSPPKNAEEWHRRRPEILRAVVDSLGDLPDRPAPQKTRVVSRELRRDYIIEKVDIDNGVDGIVSSLLLIPERREPKAPAILWLHSSTPDKNQILIPHTNGGDEPLGEVLVKSGYVVMAPDAYWHGDRAGSGPSGRSSKGLSEEEDLFKRNLWLGRTLWGMFVRDDRIALDYLCGRAEVDPARIGATGMSMGSTRAWWLAAVDDRIAAVVAVSCLTRYQQLLAHGELRQHGVYYFVSGLLKRFDTEAVVALVAPRPFLALTGELDAGSPADGVRIVDRIVGETYKNLGVQERFRSVLYPEIGHTYTREMRGETIAWFDRFLKPSK